MDHDSVTFIDHGSIIRCYAIGNWAVLEKCISELITEAKRIVRAVPRRPKKNVLRFIQLFTGRVT